MRSCICLDYARFGSAAQGLQVPSSDLNAVSYLDLSKGGDVATLVPLFVKYLTNLFPGATDHTKAVFKHSIIYGKAYYLRWPRSFATRANSVNDWVT